MVYGTSEQERPNKRLQLTAFGAQDRWYFDTFCRALAAAEAQHVGPQHRSPTRLIAQRRTTQMPYHTLIARIS